MAGVCDMAFRAVCRSHGAGLTYTEMVSAKALVYQDSKTRALLQLGEDEHPAAAQIFGSDVTCMAEAAALAQEISRCDIIDINMGCPVGKVVKSGDGSALMLDPDKAMKIIEAVRKNVSKPVTIKIRKGWDKGKVNAVEFSQMAEAAGAAAIAVHGRTRVQMYAGTADWDIIREVKRSVGVPVLANGDVFSAEDAARILRYTGADLAMIGRGAFGNPWLFSQAGALLEGSTIPPLPSLRARIDTAVTQFELAKKFKGEKIACLEARKHFAWYLKGVRNAGYFRDKITKIETMADIYRLAEAIKSELR
jgi:nifR3 family TIM-barrel protein